MEGLMLVMAGALWALEKAIYVMVFLLGMLFIAVAGLAGLVLFVGAMTLLHQPFWITTASLWAAFVSGASCAGIPIYRSWKECR